MDTKQVLGNETNTTRPGMGDLEFEAPVATSFASVAELSQALQRAAYAHGEHEKRNGGEYDEKWPDWYAAYMVAEQNGAELPV